MAENDLAGMNEKKRGRGQNIYVDQDMAFLCPLDRMKWLENELFGSWVAPDRTILCNFEQNKRNCFEGLRFYEHNQNGQGARIPVMDIKDNGKELVLEVEIPGLSKDDIEVEVTQGSISIHGEKKKGGQEEKGGHNMEGKDLVWSSKMRLNEPILPESSFASFNNGILRITLVKKDPFQRAHKLEIR
jgi:HSP20 family molecular chaperone IbpA